MKNTNTFVIAVIALILSLVALGVSVNNAIKLQANLLLEQSTTIDMVDHTEELDMVDHTEELDMVDDTEELDMIDHTEELDLQ